MNPPMPATNLTRPDWHDAFLTMLPRIRDAIRVAFRHLPGDHRDEAIQEAVANACVRFARLAERGLADRAFPTVLARFAVAQCGTAGPWARPAIVATSARRVVSDGNDMPSNASAVPWRARAAGKTRCSRTAARRCRTRRDSGSTSRNGCRGSRVAIAGSPRRWPWAIRPGRWRGGWRRPRGGCRSCGASCAIRGWRFTARRSGPGVERGRPRRGGRRPGGWAETPGRGGHRPRVPAAVRSFGAGVVRVTGWEWRLPSPASGHARPLEIASGSWRIQAPIRCPARAGGPGGSLPSRIRMWPPCRSGGRLPGMVGPPPARIDILAATGRQGGLPERRVGPARGRLGPAASG
ncbi:MAG: hypothetical protein JWN86_7 [Planctomycetota bacterium]|nr:hypothetical protein [Planctomycetota bacterium]